MSDTAITINIHYDLVFSSDDDADTGKGWYFQHSNGEVSKSYALKADALRDHYNDSIKWPIPEVTRKCRGHCGQMITFDQAITTRKGLMCTDCSKDFVDPSAERQESAESMPDRIFRDPQDD